MPEERRISRRKAVMHLGAGIAGMTRFATLPRVV